jgi:hypothetical protein
LREPQRAARILFRSVATATPLPLSLKVPALGLDLCPGCGESLLIEHEKGSFGVKSAGSYADTQVMDIEQHRTPHNESPTAPRPVFEGYRDGSASDPVPGAPTGENRNRMVCMPSSRAIADAIIRFTIAEVRG